MKIIEIPEKVTIAIPTRETAMSPIVKIEKISTFADFLSQVLEYHEGFKAGPKMARLFNKLMTIVDSIKPDDKFVKFEDEDFKYVEDSVRAASWITPRINAAYVPFYSAVENAKTEAK